MTGLHREEDGAVLILVLIFIIVTALVGVALASLTSTNLMATSSLQAKRGVEYSADGAVDAAIESMRYNTSYSLTRVPQPCFPAGDFSGTNIPLTVNGASIYVFCRLGSATPPNHGRTVGLIACPTSSSCLHSSPAPEVVAEVTFGDYNDLGAPDPGFSMTIVSWEDSA